MSLVATLALFAVAWVLSDQGYQFFAFLAFVAACLSLAGWAFQPKAGRGGSVKSTRDGVIVENNGPEIPEVIQVKIKPDWGGKMFHEKRALAMGDSANTIGRTIARIIFGKKKAK